MTAVEGVWVEGAVDSVRQAGAIGTVEINTREWSRYWCGIFD